MKTIGNNDNTQNDYAAFIAIDWADQQHQVSLQVAGQTKIETGTLKHTPEAIGAWVAQLRERFGGRPVAIALEQSRGALIHALLAYDFVVLYPLHPAAVAHFRQSFKSSGAKSDPQDADHILAILTKHLEELRPLQPDTEATRLLARLVEDRRQAVDQRTAHIQAAGAALKEYYPQALELVGGNLASRLAHDLVNQWPTFSAFQQAKPSTLRAFFYGHNVRSPQVIERALALAQSGRPLTTDGAILESGWRRAQMHLALIQSLNAHIADYEKAIESVFQDHPDFGLFNHLPGAGQALAPRLLASLGTDRSRFESATSLQSFAGIAPVSISSGHTHLVYCRRACPKFVRQTFHEFARLSVSYCQWARNYLDYYTAKGKPYHVIIRALAFKWIRILFRCWQDRTPYDDARYMERLRQRGSIFATWHLEKNRKKLWTGRLRGLPSCIPPGCLLSSHTPFRQLCRDALLSPRLAPAPRSSIATRHRGCYEWIAACLSACLSSIVNVSKHESLNHPVILPAGPEHLAAIAALAAVVWRAHYPGIISHAQIDYMLARMYALEALRQELAGGVGYDRILVGNELLGFAAYGPVRGNEEMKLHKLYVHPAWQRHGLGSRLLQHVEQTARRRGFRTLILAVNKANHKAVAAYRKNGFAVRESVVTDIGGGFVMDDHIMAKAL